MTFRTYALLETALESGLPFTPLRINKSSEKIIDPDIHRS
jgi:hypothetical protein